MSYDNFIRRSPVPISNAGSYRCNDGGLATTNTTGSVHGWGHEGVTRYNNQTFIPFMRNCGGHELVVYDHNHEVMSYPHFVSNTTGALDGHDYPSITVDTEGYIYCVCPSYVTGVDSGYDRLFMSKRPGDASEFDNINFGAASSHSYRKIFIIGDRIFISLSSDEEHYIRYTSLSSLKANRHGASWSAVTWFSDTAGNTECYISRFAVDSSGGLHIAYTKRDYDISSDPDGFRYVCYAYCPDPETALTVWQKSNGDSLTLPVTWATSDIIYDAFSVLVSDLVIDSTGKPIISYYIDESGSASYFFNCSFGVARHYGDGNWTNYQLDTATFGTWLSTHFPMVINDDNVLDVYTSKNYGESIVTPDYRPVRFTTTDFGNSFILNSLELPEDYYETVIYSTSTIKEHQQGEVAEGASSNLYSIFYNRNRPSIDYSTVNGWSNDNLDAYNFYDRSAWCGGGLLGFWYRRTDRPTRWYREETVNSTWWKRLFTFRFTRSTDEGRMCFGLVDTVGMFYDLISNASDGTFVTLDILTPWTATMKVSSMDGAVVTDSAGTITLTSDVEYYGDLAQEGTNFVLSIYTDKARTVHAAGSPQTVAVGSVNLAGAAHIYALFGNYDDGTIYDGFNKNCRGWFRDWIPLEV